MCQKWMVWDARHSKNMQQKAKQGNKNKTMQQQKGKQWQTRHKKAKKAKTKKAKKAKRKCKKKGNQANRRPKRATSTKTIRNDFPTFSLFWAWFRRFALSAPPEPIPKKREGRTNPAGEGKSLKIPAVSTVWGFLLFSF